MKITVFNSSPSKGESNTQLIADAFLEGAKNKGAEVETVYLKDHDINHCSGCFSCWYNTPGECIYEDDMQVLIEKYMSSDVVVYASPLYTWSVTAYLKNFVDRMIPMLSPSLQMAQGKYDLKKKKQPPRISVICNCGFPGENNFDIVKPLFAMTKPIFEIYRNCGRALKTETGEVRRKVDIFLENVKKSGECIALERDVPDEIIKNINMEIVSTKEYIKMLGMK